MLVLGLADTTDPDRANVAKKHQRRGTTLMEYLMMISLIITVCLVGIGFFGSENSKVADAAGTAIQKSLKKGSGN